MRRSTRQFADREIRQEPGRGFLDLNAHETVRDDLAFVRSDNTRLDTFVLRPRLGLRKVHVETDPAATNGSWALGSDHTTYAVASSASHLLVPEGGFAFHHSFVADREANTAYVLSTRISGAKNYGPITITLSSSGVVTSEWRDASETAHSIASSAVSDGATVHLLLVYDAKAGTFTQYINGAANGTPETGLASTLKPAQDAVDWWFGANNDGSSSAVSTTGFQGRNDSTYLLSFRGIDPSDLVTRLRKSTWKEWTNPDSAMVLMHYDWNESSGTTVTDRSRFKNDMAITGSPASEAGLVFPADNGNFIDTLQNANGGRINTAVLGGRVLYETIREASA